MENRKRNKEIKSPSQQIQLERDADFVSLYANNVRFEQSIWDLKIIFGQLDQGGDHAKIELHTAMTIPWLQAKLMSHLLRVNIALHEEQHGKILIPPGLIPPELPLEGELKNNLQAQKQKAIVDKLREQFLADSR